MKKEKYPGKRRWILYLIQQAAFLCAVFGFVLLIAYSFVTLVSHEVENGDMLHSNIEISFDLFPSEEHFEDTESFENMLYCVLQDVIRYNVLQSQMEVNGKFVGTKYINLDAFANRKHSSSFSGDVVYTLENLLKWGRYGVTVSVRDYSETEFLFAFALQNEDIMNELMLINDKYDGFLTLEQKDVLRSKYIPFEEQNNYGPMEKEEKNEEARILIRSFNEWSKKKDKENYSKEAYEIILSGASNEIILEENTPVISSEAAKDEITLYFNDWDAQAKDALRNGTDNIVIKLHQRLAEIVLAAPDQIAGLYIDEETGELHVYTIIVEERYAPVDNESLFYMCRNWKEYLDYCNMLTKTVEELSYNYQEYLDFQNKYGEGKTNICYDFKMNMLGENVEISNMDVSIVSLEGESEEYLQENYKKYLLYNPKNIDLKTNISQNLITAKEIISLLNKYEYAYTNEAKIFIGLNKDYAVKDDFFYASQAYSILYRFHYLFYLMMLLGAGTYLVLFLYLTVTAEGKTEESRTKYWFDRMPTEFYFLTVILTGILCIIPIKLIRQLWEDSYYFSNHRWEISILTCLLFFIISNVICLYWYSFIRRIKSGDIIKNSILMKGFSWVIKGFTTVFENTSALFKTILTYGLVVGYNLILCAALCVIFIQAYRFNIGAFLFRFWLLVLLVLFVAGNGFLFYKWFQFQVHKQKVIKGIENIRDGEVNFKIETKGMHGENLKVADAINSIGDGIKEAVETSMKDERLKTDLITNVSHDIKTPLTSIINYVDLLKREKITDEPVKGYIEVLDKKSQRLKQLTDDLVEASKISSGNITLHFEKINLSELLLQTIGEFAEKFEEKNLTIVDHFTGDCAFIYADSRRIFRVVENLFQNIYKYAMPGTRVYLDKRISTENEVTMVLKNISAQALNINAEELTERFIRGDVSRSTEGSGLGLSIAKNLTQLMHGEFAIYLDGDLFRVNITFKLYEESAEN